MRLIRFMVLILIGLSVSACSKQRAAAEPHDFCRKQMFEGSRFTVCSNEGSELHLVAAGPDERPLRSFTEIAGHIDVNSVAFAMNAGMFGEDGRPIGLARRDRILVHKLNLRDGGGNFHLKPNGVFMVLCGGAPAIFASDAMPEFRCAPRLSTQSGPMLVIGGHLHPRIAADGPSRFIRNGVGVRGSEALFVISDDPVSFGRFARFFRDVLKTPNALYFDGSVGSLWDPAEGRQDAQAPLGPIIVALKPTMHER